MSQTQPFCDLSYSWTHLESTFPSFSICMQWKLGKSLPPTEQVIYSRVCTQLSLQHRPGAQSDHCVSSVSHCLWWKRKIQRRLPSQRRVHDPHACSCSSLSVCALRGGEMSTAGRGQHFFPLLGSTGWLCEAAAGRLKSFTAHKQEHLWLFETDSIGNHVYSHINLPDLSTDFIPSSSCSYPDLHPACWLMVWC